MDHDFILLIRAADAGATYLSFRWLDDPTHPEVHSITEPAMRRLIARLDAVLPGPADPGDPSSSVRKALSGPFTRLYSEYALSLALTETLIPGQVATALRDRAGRGRVLVRITPSRAIARVPFELLVIDDPRRLIEMADVSYDPPAAIHLRRGRIPEAWTESVSERPVLYVVDPDLPPGSGLAQILPNPRKSTPPLQANTQMYLERIGAMPHLGGSGVGKTIGRWELSDALRAGPSRLVYVGHVSSTLDQPGSASLHLSDDGQEWGLAAPQNNAHLPLSALDLLLGTAAPELGPDADVPAETGRPGHDLWPMPPRVVLIACEGGADYRSSETFGLVIAILSAGAEVLTTTRWTLPSDAAFREFADVTGIPGPTTELALAVDDTHQSADPVAALGEWQRAKLDQWRSDPGAATSPLTWAAAGTHVCPPREVLVADDERS